MAQRSESAQLTWSVAVEEDQAAEQSAQATSSVMTPTWHQKASKLLSRLSWPIRTSLSCFVASIAMQLAADSVDLHDAKIAARVFAPITAALCCTTTIGAGVQTSSLVLMGSVLGAIISVVFSFGAYLFPGAHIVALGIVAMCVLVPSFQPTLVKIVLIINTVVLCHTADAKSERDILQPVVLVLSCATGATSALLVNLVLPLPGRRAVALAEAHSKEAEECLEATVLCLTRAFGVGRHHKTVLLSHADFLLQLAKQASGDAKKLLPEVEWEDSLNQCLAACWCCRPRAGEAAKKAKQSEQGAQHGPYADLDGRRAKAKASAKEVLSKRLACLESIIEIVSGFRMGLSTTLDDAIPRRAHSKLRRRFSVPGKRERQTAVELEEGGHGGQEDEAAVEVVMLASVSRSHSESFKFAPETLRPEAAAAQLESGALAGPSTGSTTGEGSAAEKGREETERRRASAVEELATREEEYTSGFDLRMSGVVEVVGERVGAWIKARGTRYGCGEEEGELEAEEALLEEALVWLRDSLTDTRAALWFRGDSTARTRRRVEALMVWGPPIGRFFLMWCLLDCVQRLLRAGQHSHSRAPTADEPAKEGPGTRSEQDQPASGEETGRGWGKRLVGVVSGAQDTHGKRVVYAAKVALAPAEVDEGVKLTRGEQLVAALLVGEKLSGSGLWAGAAVCFIGPRALDSAGGSYRLAAQRVTGTVAGAVFASLMMLLLYTSTINFTHHLLLALWVLLCSVLRSNPSAAYGALVAIITPYICVLASTSPPASIELWVFRRIEQNVVGVLIFCLVELLVWPAYATDALRSELAGNLRACGDVLGVVVSPPTLCRKCAAADADAAEEMLGGVQTKLATQVQLMAEAAADPTWVLVAGFPMVRVQALLEEGVCELLAVLWLMRRVVLHWSAADSSLQEACSDPIRAFVGPLRAPLKDAQTKLSHLLCSLASELDSDPAADLNAESATAYSAAQEALAEFKQRYTQQCSALIADGRGAMPSNDLVLPLSALIFCITHMLRTVGGFMGGLRQLGVVLRTGYVLDAVREVRGNYLQQTPARVLGFASASALLSPAARAVEAADEGQDAVACEGVRSRCMRCNAARSSVIVAQQ